MEIILTVNGYFYVVLSRIANRNAIFEGGPYFHNQVGLFIKPGHVGFDPIEELLSKILLWVQLLHIPMEF